MATKIVVNRKSELVNRMRPIQVFIDNIEVGHVANGSSEEFNVSPGIHEMKCKVNWFSSQILTVSITEGETKFLKVRSGLRYYAVLYILLILSLVAGLLLRLANIPKPDLLELCQAIGVAPFILYILYFFTLGRKKYLILEDDKENLFS